MEKVEAKKLLEKYSLGLCTDAEKALVESFYNSYKPAQEYSKSEAELVSNLNRIEQTLPVPKRKSLRTLWPRFASAAAVLIFISIGIYFYMNSNTDESTQIATTKKVNNIAPGSNKAVLTLGNGKKISLTDAGNGTIAKQSGIKIIKTDDGQLIYSVSVSELKSILPEYNTISTPRGGQYQVSLPDGTNVWLNAASSLKYPANFTSLKERRVELIGEAYFEVVHNKTLPFRVETEEQVVEVLGTHFNINSYTDEPIVTTTLMEGSVKVHSIANNVIIKPGQQTILVHASKQISVQKANLGIALAWRNGTFQFDNETIESVMRKISRWYDVDVVFQKNCTKQGFVGTISRFENVSEVLQMLEHTGTVHFKIDGRRITVMP